MRGLICIVALAAAGASIQTAHAAEVEKGHYRVVSLTPFTAAGGVELPAEYMRKLMVDVAEQLSATKRFSHVVTEGQSTSDAGPVVQLSGTVTEFRKGNRAMRYFVGMGTGKTVVKARVAFRDAKTGKTLLEKDVDGVVWIGVGGGDSSGATRGLAKEVAKVAKAAL